MTLEAVGGLIASIGIEECVKSLVNTVVETHIKPILQKHADYKDNSVELEECLREYLEESYTKSMEMNTIVFKGIPKSLYELYIPLTITKADSFNSDVLEEYKVDNTCVEILKKHSKISIMDTAGMGKSTIVKYMAVQVINTNSYIPIVIELRKMDKSKSIIDCILEQFELLDKKIEKADLIKMLKRGDFIIFFDGYDEITNENRGGVLDNIQKFIRKAGKNQYVITSRDEEDLNGLGDFQKFSIKPMSMEEAFDLIRKYDECGEKSSKLIERIKKDDQLEVLKEFLVNPLLTSLLYKTFEYKEEIAYKKLGFYSQVYDALFNDHDKTKGGAYVHPKKSLLDSLDFEKLLRRIAVISLKKNQVEFNKAELLENIEKSIKGMPWVKTSAIDVLDDLTHAVPLFQKDGNNFKWVHKSFMEYFAAGYICFDSGKTEELFEKMVTSTSIMKYKNVLDFCYDMKPDIAQKRIVYPHICKFIDSYESNYNNKQYETYAYSLVDFRKSRGFTHEFRLIRYKDKEEAYDTLTEKKDISKIFEPVNGCAMRIAAYMKTANLISFGRKNSYYINELLLYKGLDIFKSDKDRVVPDTNKDINIKEGSYEISDDMRLSVNRNEEYFNYVTNLIRQIDRKIPFLDYDKCKKLESKLKKDIQEQETIEEDFDI